MQGGRKHCSTVAPLRGTKEEEEKRKGGTEEERGTRGREEEEKRRRTRVRGKKSEGERKGGRKQGRKDGRKKLSFGWVQASFIMVVPLWVRRTIWEVKRSRKGGKRMEG